MITVNFFVSTRKDKKMMAIFYEDGKRLKTVHFGQKGASDFTEHKDNDRMQRYLIRHQKRENWIDPFSAGTLSRFILWGTPDLETNIKIYKKRFGFEN